MPLQGRIWTGLTLIAGAASLRASIYSWQPEDPWRFCFYLILTSLAAGLEFRIPGTLDPVSGGFLFSLIGIAELPLGQAITIALTGAAVRWRNRRAAIDIVTAGVGTAIVYPVYHWPPVHRIAVTGPFLMVLAAMLYFGLTTVPPAALQAVMKRRTPAGFWRTTCFRAVSHGLVAGLIAWMIGLISSRLSWQTSILVLPIVYFIHCFYNLYLKRISEEKTHAEETTALHLRTIEALALAIEAKDHATSSHLRRVCLYAVEIGKEMGLSGLELEALRAAALLHDIGKLAIPEHIISKPGRLTPEEFEKMKIHPVVGAEILERVAFPYPVAPLVRAHHERWDGSGYPDGLSGEAIPQGARILAAVDCLDALSSDRQYRRALPLDAAMREVTAMAGKALDPRVVAVLNRRYRELDQMSQTLPSNESSSMGITSSGAGAGWRANLRRMEGDFLASIASARQEAQLVFELTQDLGNSLSLHETLTIVSLRLRQMIPYEAIAVFIGSGKVLLPHYVNGDYSRQLSSLEIPLGEGISGWVAENRKSIVNGNPALEAAGPDDAGRLAGLRSAMAVPLEGVQGVVGVLTLYGTLKDAFSRDHLRILLAISTKISLAIENALRFQVAEDSASTDYLTMLPNSRSLFLHLESELARCRRTAQPLTVLVCDVDGFKQVNDRFGHLEGNKVLRFLANVLRENCREYDYVARMGGDEFVILLPGSDREAVYRRITEFQSVASEAAGMAVAAGLISLSIGEAFYPDDGSDAEQLLAAADQRMYESKHAAKKARSKGIHLLPPIHTNSVS